MPDALLLAADEKVSISLQELFHENNFRLKFTFDPVLALEWLKTRSFDLLLVPAALAFEEQQQAGYALWESNPQASLVVYDPHDDKGLNKKKVRLSGATLITGSRYLEYLQRVVAKILGCSFFNKSEFSVLVVEDLDAARDIICSFVESLGYPKVLGVSSASDALRLLEEEASSIDCVITDERMPNMSGHELIEVLRGRDKFQDLPIIVLTAHGTEDCFLQSLKVGASGFLVKPPSKSDLLRELARAMRIKNGLERTRLVEEDDIEEVMKLF